MNLSIHMSGGTDTVTIDGHTFDRSRMTKSERNTFSGMIRDTLIKTGQVKAKSRRNRPAKGRIR